MRNATATAISTAGMLLLLAALGLLAQAQLGGWLRELDRPAVAQEILPAQLESRTNLEESATWEAGLAAEAPAPIEALDLGEPYWIRMPSIDLNAGITAVGIVNGEYDIPLWDVGWQSDSQPLGTPGNTLFNGHVETINAGRVFANLHLAAPGDALYVYTDQYRTEWQVESVNVVPNADHSFLAPTDDIRLTLYTCEGAFNWATQQYSHYRVVVAKYVGSSERSSFWDSNGGIAQ